MPRGAGLLGFGLLGFVLPGDDGLPGVGVLVDVLDTTDVDVPVETPIPEPCSGAPAFAEYAEAPADRATPQTARIPAARTASFI